MKYFKNSDSFLNEDIKKVDMDINFKKIISFFTSPITTGIRKERLNIVAQRLDDYLDIVYKEYILKKQGTDTSNLSYQEIDTQVVVEPITSDNAEEPQEPEKQEETPEEKKDWERMNASDYNIIVDQNNKKINDIIKSIPDKFKNKKVKLQKIKDIDISELNLSYDNPLSYEDKKELEAIWSEYIKLIGNNNTMDIITDYYRKLQEINIQIDTLNQKREQLFQTKKGTSGDTAQVLRDKINDIANSINSLQDKKTEYSEKMEEVFNKLKGVVNESKDWKQGSVYNEKWTAEDSKELTNIINPYKINEFFLKADMIIDGANDDKKEILKKHWEFQLNKVYQKWYYTYEIENLKQTVKTYSKRLDYQKNIPVKKDEIKIESYLDSQLGMYITNYKEPYARINTDTRAYAILTIGRKLFLALKNEETLNYSLIGNLILNESNKLVIDNYFNNKNNEIVLDFPNGQLKLEKDFKKYPNITIQGKTIFNRGKDKSIKTDLLIISTLKEKGFDIILNNSGLKKRELDL